jgi:RND family efflux transporter MFP subunit
MPRRKAFWIGLVLLVLAAGAGYAYYTHVYLPDQGPPEPVITTAQVVRGDLIVSVSGSGTLSPASEVALGFETGGYLADVYVAVGDRVQEGDVLARLETDDLELAVAEAEMDLRSALLDLDDVLEETSEADLADARAALRSAQAALTVAQYGYQTAQNSDLDAAVTARQIQFQYDVDQYWSVEDGFNAGSKSEDKLAEAWDRWASSEAALNDAIRQAQMEGLDAWNQVDQAKNRVYQAQENLELLQTGPTTDTVVRAQLKVDKATLALDDARDDLAAAEVRAPLDGTVVELSAATPGEAVGTAPFITLADLEEPLLVFWVEEADMSGVAPGNQVEIVFEALPDHTYRGEVIRVDPALVTVDNTLAVQGWASIDLSPGQTRLLGGMNADVEVISAETRDTLLVPLEALRELGWDQYAVFVVQPDGEMVLRVVEVGLKDFVYAELVSGVQPGEVVSTGTAESAEETEVPEFGPPGGGPPGGGFMFFR